MKKYKSEQLMVIHQNAKEMYAIGAISEARMQEYDELCLRKPAAPVPRVSTQMRDGVLRSATPVYAHGK